MSFLLRPFANSRRKATQLVLLWALGAVACQGYPFELRLPQKTTGRQVNQNVATLVPADILFVIDNSGSMLNQRRELIHNMRQFIEQMARSENDFHLGIVTTDIECNIPERNCSGTLNVSKSCCAMVQNGNLTTCQDEDTDGDGKIDWSNCDAGRLRAPKGQLSYFSRPAEDPNAWIDAVSQTIEDLGCDGSGYESGFEAARRAIACASGSTACQDANVQQRNTGFLREEADLVVIFVTDEDDCSFVDAQTYLAPTDASQSSEQASHLCSPAECYAYYGQELDDDHNGLQNWADPNYYVHDGGNPVFTCGSSLAPVDRVVNPPYPEAVNTYLQALIDAKGGDVRKVRAAGIVSGVADTSQPLAFRSDVCVNLGVLADGTGGLGPTNACGCWSASAVSGQLGSHNPYCAVTEQISGRSTPSPENLVSNECSSVGTGTSDPTSTNEPQPGCKALPAGRYVQFLENLSTLRTQKGLSSNTLIDSICDTSFSDTLYRIVNTVILSDCFQLGVTPNSIDDISVELNGKTLARVDVASASAGWSWVPSSQMICLEGGLHKNIGDRFAIFVIEPS